MPFGNRQLLMFHQTYSSQAAFPTLPYVALVKSQLSKLAKKYPRSLREKIHIPETNVTTISSYFFFFRDEVGI